MKIAFDRNYNLNASEGGNYRWSANLSYFLREEGHEIVVSRPGLDTGCDLFIFPERQSAHLCKSKYHLNFMWGADSNFKEDKDFKSNKSVITCPYRVHQEHLKLLQVRWEEETGHKSYDAFVPWAYPDSFIGNIMPEHKDDPFGRKTISWISKGWFEKRYIGTPFGEARIENGLRTLRALARLSKEVDFKLVMFGSPTWGGNQLDQIHSTHPGFRAKEMASGINIEFKTGNWHDVMRFIPEVKLNLHVAGLPSSMCEANLAGALPMVYKNNVDIMSQIPDEIGLLPDMEDASEDLIFEALRTFWTDEDAYNRAKNWHQEWFKEHRTEGLRKCWRETLRVLEEVQG